MNRLVLFVALFSGCNQLTPRVVSVNGRAVEVVSAGPDTPTVVFEAGLGSDWSAWDAVAGEVSRTARVFAYSRPGYGRSASATTPRDASQIVEELRALLVTQAHLPPYVLVGHSFGGTYMELFAKAHPDEVSAVVLVEPRPAEFARECDARGLSGCSISPTAAKSLPRVQQDELAAFDEASAQLRAVGGFGAKPVRVLTATAHSESPEWEALWQSMHAALAAEADGQQSLFDASHNLEVERAAEVARIVLEVMPR